jgi:hypothetical protein
MLKIAARKMRAEWWKGILAGWLLTAFRETQSILILQFLDLVETVNARCYCTEMLHKKEAVRMKQTQP